VPPHSKAVAAAAALQGAFGTGRGPEFKIQDSKFKIENPKTKIQDATLKRQNRKLEGENSIFEIEVQIRKSIINNLEFVVVVGRGLGRGWD
jgi:hypothetical protein